MMAAAALVLVLLNAVTPAGSEPGVKARVQTHIHRGTLLYRRGDLVGALRELEQAQAPHPSPKLWFDIGRVNRDLGRSLQAMEAFETFLASDPHPSAEASATAQAAVRQLRHELGRVHVDCSVDGATIVLDGNRLGETPLPRDTWVLPGSHLLAAQAAGSETSTQITLGPGDAQTVVLELAHPPPTAAPAELPVENAPKITGTAPAPAIQETSPRRTWAWISGGVAVASLAGAVTSGLLLRSRFQELDRSCGSASPRQAGCSAGDLRELDTRKTVTDILWGVAGVAAVTAVLLWISESRAVAVTPVVGQHGVGMAAHAHF